MNDELQKRLESREWRAFAIGELFNVDKGIYLPEKDITEGNIPYITANSSNNGVTKFIGNKPLFEGNTITIEKINFKAFYQPNPYYCSHDVTVLQHSKLNKYNGIFISNMISRQGEKYSYGKQAQLNVTKRESVLLPVNNKNNVDWDFMEQFIKDLEFKTKPKDAFKAHTINDWRELEEVEWRDFYLIDIFDIKRGNQNNMSMCKEGDIPLVSAKKTNNGYKMFISDNGKPLFEEEILTLNNDGDGGVGIAYYQPHYIALDTHVTGLIPKNKINKYSLLFVSRLITNQREKYSHGYSINNRRLRRQKIMLPTDDYGKPDWLFMEQYMQRIENDLRCKVMNTKII